MSPPPKATDTAEMHAADVAKFTERIGHLKDRFDTHEDQCEERKREIFNRLGTIERLIYIGIGGLIVLGGTVSIIGGNIINRLAH